MITIAKCHRVNEVSSAIRSCVLRIYCRMKKYHELKLKLPNIIYTGITETVHIMLIEIAEKVSFSITYVHFVKCFFAPTFSSDNNQNSILIIKICEIKISFHETLSCPVFKRSRKRT